MTHHTDLFVALGKLDALEVLCNMDPFRPPPRMPQIVPSRHENSGLRLWYRFLNCGYRLPTVAGTDRSGNYVSIGGNRVYARVDGAFTYEHWIRALREGRSFITNSPMLRLTVDGAGPGAELRRTPGGAAPLTVRAEVASQMPVDELEILVNG